MPGVSEAGVKEAEPPESVDEPRTVVPSRNWTVPVAVDGVTAAVKVTDCLVLDGFALEVTATDELAFTVRLTAGDVAAGKVLFPLYCAVKE